MREIVSFDEIEKLREKENRCKIYWIDMEKRLLYVKMNGEEYSGLTPEETIKRFGTNYNLMQEFRFLLQKKENENEEKILQDNQSLKTQIIDICISEIRENNIYKDKLSIEEIKSMLERNIDAVYIIVDRPDRNNNNIKISGWYNIESKNIYVKAEKPEELKELIKNGNIENISDEIIGVICHENLHALSPNGLKFTEDGIIKGTAINEGIVQFMVEEIMGKYFHNNGYREEVRNVEKLLAIYGQDIIDAYLDGNIWSYLPKNELLIEYILCSDYLLSLKEHEEEEMINISYLRAKLGEIERKLMNQNGINIYNLIKYSISWPEYLQEGLDENMIKKAVEKFFQEEHQEELGKRRFLPPAGMDTKIILEAIAEQSRKQNNGKISFKDFAKLNMLRGYTILLVDWFIDDNNNDFNLSCENILDMIEEVQSPEEEESYIKRLVASKYLKRGLNKRYTQEDYKDEEKYKDLCKKEYIIDQLTEISSYTYEKSLDELMKKISTIKDWEYYRTTKGNWIVVNSDNGKIIYLEDEMDNINEKFFTEKNKKGKYILKGYAENENGEQIPLNMELGRNFLDDTTQIDREIIEQTSDIRIGGIRSTISRAKNLMITNSEKEKGDRNDG